ncbi:MAG TPA: peptidoglycan -binding protein, partial [Acetobacteraceae bacterium]|nr:peptidoglycan -binding protein [Acetobacteraceae bacterium]
GQALSRDLAEARTQQQATARDLAATQAQGQALTRELAEARDRQQATARDLAAAQAQGQAAARDLEARRREAETLAAELAAARTALDAARRDVAALREEAARLDQTVRADRTTIEARLSDIARLSNEIRALTALRDELERRARDALARAEDEARRRQQAEAQGGEFARLSESARAQAALLAQQIEVLRAELARVGAALEAAETATRDRDVQIANLGQRLNAALAQRVEELQSYRSDFFGRLRRVLGDRPEVRIVGDRFVFQSEVLFPAGSAELSEAGQQQIRNIGRVLQDIARQFPPDLNWVLRVDGHADRTPVRGGRFASNWELSSARAIAVAQLLIADGLAPNRVAATAFGDTQPLDERETPDAYARNRRIELRLEPVPVAPPAATQAPPDPRRAAREVLGALACARVTVTEEAGGLRVAGIARRGAEAELRAALQSRAAAGALANLDIRPFGEALCEVVEALRPVPIASGNSALRLQVVGAEPLPPGSLLRTDIVMPDWAGQLALFYIATDGQVVRLAVLDRQAAGARFRLGDPRGAFTGWPVVEPFGTELLVAIASEGPLFQPARPEAEPVRSFAPALATAVETARREGRRLAVQVVPVETGP